MLFGVGGIGLEIIGFVILLKYTREPNYDDLEKWIKNLPHNTKYEDIVRHNLYYRKIESLHDGDPIKFRKPDLFAKFWNGRKNFGIYMVIFGLFGQLIQISLSYLF